MRTTYSLLFVMLLFTYYTGSTQSMSANINFSREGNISNALPAQNDDFYNHVIQLNGRSHPVSPYGSNDKFMEDCYGGNNAFLEQRLDKLFKDIIDKSRGKKMKVLFFAHGGLNSTGAAIEAAYRDYQEIKRYNLEREKNNDTTIYPVFCNWNTGLISSYFQHYSVIRHGERISSTGGWFLKSTRFLGLLVSGPVMATIDLTCGLLKTPIYYGEGFFGSRDGMLKNHRKYLTKYYNEASNNDIKIFGNISGQRLDFKTRVLCDKSLYFLAQVTGGGTYSIVNGCGSAAWKNMSRRVISMYRNNEQFYEEKENNECLQITSLSYKDFNYNNDLNGPMSLIFKHLLKHANNNRDIVMNIDFIGHSMGTMVWNEGFRLFGDTMISVTNIKINNIVYMGAACSIKDWETSVGKILRKSQQTQFYNLSIHPKREKQELFFPIAVPPGSLLEWIDRLYEGPISFEDRTIGKYENLLTASSILNTSYKKQIHIKCFGYAYTKDDIKNTPVKHGGFRGKKYWDPNFWK